MSSDSVGIKQRSTQPKIDISKLLAQSEFVSDIVLLKFSLDGHLKPTKTFNRKMVLKSKRTAW